MWLAHELGLRVVEHEGRIIGLARNGEYAPVMSHVTEGDVRGRKIIGNLPMKLAAIAAEYVAIEYEGNPRGTEYSAEDMKAAGAYLQRYKVTRSRGWPPQNIHIPEYPHPEGL